MSVFSIIFYYHFGKSCQILVSCIFLTRQIRHSAFNPRFYPFQCRRPPPHLPSPLWGFTLQSISVIKGGRAGNYKICGIIILLFEWVWFRQFRRETFCTVHGQTIYSSGIQHFLNLTKIKPCNILFCFFLTPISNTE